MSIIKNVSDLIFEVCGERDVSFEKVKKAIYKGTDCGAYVHVISKNDIPTGIHVGSIVEGSDVEIDAAPLMFPFDSEKFWEAVEYVDAEAQDEWNLAHTDFDGDTWL